MIVLLIGLQVKVMACLGRFHDFSSGYSKFQFYGVSFSFGCGMDGCSWCSCIVMLMLSLWK